MTLRRLLSAAALAGLISACGVDGTIPEAPEHGDREQQLEEFLTENSGVFEHSAAVAVVEDGEVHVATTGEAEPETVFEIASLSKPLTGMLLADAADRGELQLDDELAAMLPTLEGTEVGAVPLEELATHTSGLGLVPEAEGFGQESDRLRSEGRNPYPVDAEELIDLAAEEEVSGGGSYWYSNVGMSLLGHGIAQNAGMTYEELLEERLLEPLGMENTYASHHEGHPSDELLIDGNGRGEVETFASEGFAPSSSLRSSTADFAALSLAVLEAEAPGMSAVEESALQERMGLGWALEDSRYAWHNGISHGYGTIIWIDLEEETAVVIFSNDAQDLTAVGRDLLDSL